MVKKQLTHVEFVLLGSHAREEEGRVGSNGVSVLLFLKVFQAWSIIYVIHIWEILVIS